MGQERAHLGHDPENSSGQTERSKLKRKEYEKVLRELQAEAEKVDAAIAANLEELGYGG